MATQSSN